MLLTYVLLYFFIENNDFPSKIRLVDGRWLSVPTGAVLCDGRVAFQQNGIVYQLPGTLVDWCRTFKGGPANAKPPITDPHAIPWAHPMFASKGRTNRTIALTSERLKHFIAHKGPQEDLSHLFRIPELEPIMNLPANQRRFVNNAAEDETEGAAQEGLSKKNAKAKHPKPKEKESGKKNRNQTKEDDQADDEGLGFDESVWEDFEDSDSLPDKGEPPES